MIQVAVTRGGTKKHHKKNSTRPLVAVILLQKVVIPLLFLGGLHFHLQLYIKQPPRIRSVGL